jgi:hypothetical protein
MMKEDKKTFIHLMMIATLAVQVLNMLLQMHAMNLI